VIVSFDLDDTLFINPQTCEAERRLPFPLHLLFHDRLRKGTLSLFRRLKAQGISVWIYTTSYRSPRYIRYLFRCYGIALDNIVNGVRREKEVQGSRAEAMPSKYPSKYRIALHVDDDPSVQENGDVYGFSVCLIRPEDDLETVVMQVVEKVCRIGPA
jgi:hypothetical protein